MSIEEIVEYVESLGAVLVQRPGPGDGTPEIAWGDVFVYYSPDGVLPRAQPFATIVTKDYPGEPSSGLDGDAFRVNVDAGRRGTQEPAADPTAHDVVLPHPVYAAAGWVCIVEPGPATYDELRRLLQEAHAAAARRHHRRHD